ncbi:hypothetical protein PHYBLDRAFT_70453 [Phycomyces blakesleeanus NRRL 1555(-)]|uniref:Uncharacterized protein n=1 Tax=Phycomyces blakesleeanus (strain ATCC 8743b / DSM 1359 / FGSC 10004 / NBRC 33097 / NRRL 1555) TaxID=763407 RepID=A0A163DA62_PHYB8|nr:hypothetical protein PHYBLDRAFT_70453 [Phycomyces blakesleeanus NRRL 1555(-)]OAD69890.1 hypothetical protein PHYBLDRAFT_70453 [Phycomyces blakesleeanus NRRL 1555(-)]|eukprot:XP_018287930.1 hypothetical protein PHYBLDRAFT_70453 [Phycomyces blakesleeanus NRRL 1555(-)]
MTVSPAVRPVFLITRHTTQPNNRHSLTHEFTLLIIVSQSFRTDNLSKHSCRGPDTLVLEQAYFRQEPPYIVYAISFEKYHVDMSSRIQRIRFSFRGLDSR